MQDLPWRNIWSSDNHIEVLNEHLLLLVGRFVPTNIVRVRNKDKPWFDDQCKHAFGLKQEAHIRWVIFLTSFAFTSSEVRRLLLDLHPYGGSDTLGMFHLFLKITADVLPPS